MKKITLLALILTTSSLIYTQNFTFGTIPDTQNLTENDDDAATITQITEWYVDKQDSLNIKFVASLGDMTQWGAEDQWKRVRKSYDVFKKANLPYAPCQGNHDPTLNLLNKYFPESEFKNTPTYGGNFKGMENAYYLFSANKTDFIVVVIQSHDQYIGPYDTLSINWANMILNKYNDRHAIFITHDFFENKGLIDDVIKKHDNLFLAICGHSCAREQYWTETTPNGRTVNCIMSDYQCDEDKGASLRYYYFDFDNEKINAFTYNVKSMLYETDSNSQFSFAMPEKLLTKPVITDISNFPVFPKSNETASISATIFDKTQVKTAKVIWGLSSDKLNFEVPLKFENNTFKGVMPINSDNTTVYYKIFAQNSMGETAISQLNTYEICNDGTCLTCPFKTTENAFNDSIIEIPGIIEAEHYNDGCSKISYYDTDERNVGGAFREGGVDISECSEGGFNIGWIATGEWLKYRINVPEDGKYNFEFRIASHNHESEIHIENNGADVSGNITFPVTGSWQNWTSVLKNDVELKKGIQDIKIVIDKGDFNFNYFKVTKK